MQTLQLDYVSDKELYQSYMPFLQQGGLFVRSTEQYTIGTEILLDVLLPDSLEHSEVKGQIAWITPVGAQNGTPAGIGICFINDPEQLRNQIEKAIGRFLNSSDPTLSM